ncbi:MAG: murein biosynthesis integral membrane protein MurJ [Magnetospiraceae bacterium]
MSLVRYFVTISGFTAMSRVLGFIRDMLLAAFLAAGPVADAFFIAFKLPNLFRRLFAEGAFNAAFVPLFSETLEREGKPAAVLYARRVMGVLLWSLLVFTILIELTMPWVMAGFAPGFLDDPEKFDLAVLYTRITFPYLLFISLVSLAAGVLNSLRRFAAAAATPILLNLCLIAAILGLARFTPTPGHALAVGVFVAGIVQLAWLLWHAAKAGAALMPARPVWDDAVKRTVKRILPGAVGAGVYQINLVVDMVLASLLPTGAISYLYYADRVTQLPLGVVGVAVGTALLPVLSRHLAAGDGAAAMNSQNRSLEFALLLTVPAAVALAIIADPVVRVLFQRVNFGPEETAATAAALAAYAVGLPAFVLNKALTPGFFARGDTVTPVKAAAAAMGVNLIFNLILMGPFQHVGIAAASTIAAWTNSAVLWWLLHKREALVVDARLAARLPRICIAAGIMGLVLWFAIPGLGPWLHGPELTRALALAALIAVGLAAYGGAVLVLKAATLGEFKSSLRRR